MPIPQIPAPNINRIPKPIQSKEPIKEMINSQNQSRLTHNRDSQDYRFYNQITEAQSQMQSSGYNFQPNILLERQNKIINPKGQLNDSGRGANENPYEGFFHLRNTPKKRQIGDIPNILPNPFSRTNPESKMAYGKSFNY